MLKGDRNCKRKNIHEQWQRAQARALRWGGVGKMERRTFLVHKCDGEGADCDDLEGRASEPQEFFSAASLNGLFENRKKKGGEGGAISRQLRTGALKGADPKDLSVNRRLKKFIESVPRCS